MRRIVTIVIVVVCLIIIKNLAISIFTLWNKQDLLTQTQKELETEKKKNQQLKANFSYAQSNEFIEKQARDKLFLGKQGESEVIIPPQLQQAAIPLKLQEQKDARPNWQRWKDLFVY